MQVPGKSGWRIIEPYSMPSHGGDVLMGGVEGRQPVTQPTDQGIERLVRYACSLFIPPNHRYQVRPADNLSLALIQDPQHLELLGGKRRDELLLIDPDSAGFLVHHQPAGVSSPLE